MKDYDQIIFGTTHKLEYPEVGSMLISQPFLQDKPFKHSVILLTDIDSDGAYSGFVMNKLSQYTLSALVDISGIAGRIPIYCGGPVSTDKLFFIHTFGTSVPNAIEISDGLYMGGDFDVLLTLLDTEPAPEKNVRFFIGYSGWGGHQLIEELHERFWAVCRHFYPEHLFDDGQDSYWHYHVRKLGAEFKSWLYHPINPQSN